MQNLPFLWRDAHDIEIEIIRKGVALGIDWKDDVQVALLASEALDYHRNPHRYREPHLVVNHPREAAKLELFGLAALMLKTMEESANDDFEAHGGDVWKTFARALWRACETCPDAYVPQPGDSH